MCDSMVALGSEVEAGATLFAKNSDRHGDECQPFVQFAHEEFNRVFSSRIDFNQTDGKALKEMLKRRPELSLNELEERFSRFLASRDPFYQQQALGHPIRFLANNANRFMNSGTLEKSREERLAELNEMEKGVTR